jgi:2-dehydropantoate 2-reductase
MRIVVVGAGGVGGYFGGRLAAAGEVAFVARGSHLAALRSEGLRIESPLGAVHLPAVRATDAPSELGPCDLVLLCVKLRDSADAIASIRPLVGPQTAVISFQNGVQKDEALRDAFGAQAVMGGVGYIASHIGRPGVIVHTGTMQRLVFGEFDGSRSARAVALLDACTRAGIDAQLSDDIRKAIWEKFVFLVGLSATTATMRTTIGPIRRDARARAFLLDVMREVVAVGRASQVSLPADYAEQRLTFVDGLPETMTSSMHHDLNAGKPLEVSWLSGGVVQLGARVGVDTPLNRAVWAILALHEHGSR